MAKPQPPVVQPGGRNNRQRRVSPPPPSTHYYQAASSLPIFVDPLDIKISHVPDAITLRVDAFSEGTVNEYLRKRCKYVAHMPDGADVGFVEALRGRAEDARGAAQGEGAEGRVRARAR
jgi:hypothetical protein